ncbi:MAG: aspartate aminotransferase family protein [Bacteroidales bacterium]|nr:aspartate aminotransferase family protein [Bacteroidales bacterium]
MTERELFFRHLGLPSANPSALHITKAEGIYLYDNKGRQIIDLCAGVSVSNIGHQHPAVIEAVKKQVEQYMHIHVYGELLQSPQVKYAEFLTNQLPNQLDSVYFVNSGSEANEGALKLAKRYTDRSEIISFKNAYHGSTHGALSVLGDEYFKQAYRPLLPDIRFLEFNNEKQLEQITQKTACVIVEPVQAEAGVIVPENNFLQKLRNRCDETGTFLIFDEIQTGFGRTGELFAFMKYNVVPDIMTIAKAMGGGMAIGAFVASREIMDVLKTNPILGHITTFGGHPVSCAAAYANLKVILDEKLCDNVQKKGDLFLEKIRHSKIKSINGTGLLYAVELESAEMTSKFVEKAEKNGFITDAFLFAPQKFRIGPPLTIKDQQIQIVSELILKTLDEI